MHADHRKGRKMLFIPGDLDLDLQTRPSEGSNMSSMWIWRKSVQQFQRYFMQKQKTTDWRRQKQRTFRSSLHVVIKHFIETQAKHVEHQTSHGWI